MPDPDRQCIHLGIGWTIKVRSAGNPSGLQYLRGYAALADPGNGRILTDLDGFGLRGTPARRLDTPVESLDTAAFACRTR